MNPDDEAMTEYGLMDFFTFQVNPNTAKATRTVPGMLNTYIKSDE